MSDRKALITKSDGVLERTAKRIANLPRPVALGCSAVVDGLDMAVSGFLIGFCASLYFEWGLSMWLLLSGAASIGAFLGGIGFVVGFLLFGLPKFAYGMLQKPDRK